MSITPIPIHSFSSPSVDYYQTFLVLAGLDMGSSIDIQLYLAFAASVGVSLP
jgi:hypothetical protein